MHVPGTARQPHRRQNVASQPIPDNIPGVSGGATATAGNSAEGSLLVDTKTVNIPSASVPAIVSGSNIVITTITSPTASSSPSASSSAAASSSPNVISLGTVIATCLGAFVGLLIFISLAVLWYKHSGKQIKKSRGRSRNTRSKPERLNPWNKLEEKNIDVWEGMVPSPSTGGVIFPPTMESSSHATGSGEKLATMFKKSPSLHSTDKGSSESHGAPYFGHALAESAEFAKYHPHLAEELAKTVTPIRPYIARQNSGPPISWDGETILEDDTFVSLRTGRFDSHLTSGSESLSPTVVKVNNTPTATYSEPHRWESAEVMHYEEVESADNQQVQNPFSDLASETRKSANNPFFNARDKVEVPRRRSSNPFADSARVPRTITHTPEDSMSSTYTADRALQSLIDALGVSPEDAQERLRIASMQSTHVSVISTGSADDTSVAEFPLPPTQVPRDA